MFIISKDKNFCNQNWQSVVVLQKEDENFHFLHFFSFNSSVFQNIFRSHIRLGFQGHQIC